MSKRVIHQDGHPDSFTTYPSLCGRVGTTQTSNTRKVTCKKCKAIAKERRLEHLKWAKQRYEEQYGK